MAEVGGAEVDVSIDTAGIARELEDAVARGVDAAERVAERAFQNIGDYARDAATVIATRFVSAGKLAEKAMRRLETAARNAIQAVGDGAGAASVRLQEIDNAAQRTAQALRDIQAGDASGTLRSLSIAARTAAKRLNDLGRAANFAATELEYLERQCGRTSSALIRLATAAQISGGRVDEFRSNVRSAARDLDLLRNRGNALRGLSRDLNTLGQSSRTNLNSSGPSLFTRALKTMAGGLGTVAGLLGKVGLGAVALAGTAQAIGAIASALAATVPAAAVGATAILAVVTAVGTAKLAFHGVGDAISAAFDPSKAADFQTALQKLTPTARAFVLQLHAMQPALASLQQGAQQRVFAGLATDLTALGSSALPLVRRNVLSTATSLNLMAAGVLTAATRLARNGTLGRALDGASAGLSSLVRIPGQAVTALTQLAAAAAPTFDRLAAAAGRGADTIASKLSGAFKSGALEQSIDTAVGLIKQLGAVAGNVGVVLKNVFGGLQSGGGGAFTVLQQLTKTLADATGTKAFQKALAALAQTAKVLSVALGGVLGTALEQLAPIVVALAPIVQHLVTMLGADLGGILTSLGPVIGEVVTALGSGLTVILKSLGPILATTATAVATMVEALLPLIPPIAKLVAALLPALSPLIQLVATVFNDLASALVPVVQGIVAQLLPVLPQLNGLFQQLAPIIVQVVDALLAGLLPVVAALLPVLTPLLSTILTLASQLLPVLAQTITSLTPVIMSLSTTFVTLITALMPLINAILPLLPPLLAALLPVLQPAITLVAQLAAILAGQLGNSITNVAVPALNLVTALLQGNFSAAWTAAKSLIHGFAAYVTTTLTNLGNAVGSVFRFIGGTVSASWGAVGTVTSAAMGRLRSLVSGALSAVGGYFATQFARAKQSASEQLNALVAIARSLGGRIKSAIGNTGSLLYSAGRDVINGLISGITSKVGALTSKLHDVTKLIPLHKGPRAVDKVLLTPAGRAIMQGLINGIDGSTSALKAKLVSVTKLVQTAINTNAHNKHKVSGLSGLLATVNSDNKQLTKLAGQRDTVAKKLSAANTALAAVQKQYASAQSAAAQQVLQSGSIIASGPTSTNSIIAGLRQDVAAAAAFQKNITALKKAGLRGDLLQQISDAGVSGGGATAAALAKASKAQLAVVNTLQGQLSTQANQVGTAVADALYGAGVNAAKGLVKGLQSQESAIEKQMEKIAEAMVRAITKKLGIHSPAKATEWVGRMTNAGLLNELARGVPQVQRAADSLVRPLTAISTAAASMSPVGSLGTIRPAAQLVPAAAATAASTALVPAGLPSLTVMIGNRVVDDHVSVIVDRKFDRRDREDAQGRRS